MRIAFLIAATLAATACHDDNNGCPPGPEGEPFLLDLDLDAATVKDLLADAQQTDVLELVCADVCTALYAEAEPDLIITEIDPACSLGIDGDPDGDPAAIIGNLRCEGYSSATVCVGGRRPLGHIELPLPAADLPTYLAHCARLEAASVLAFDQLAARLELWNAPQPLIDRCRAAALEEATHATLLGDLARTAGATVHPPTQRELPVDLPAAALDNAIEGCVHEAWSALACAAAAAHAHTPELRAVYTRLAADEAEHAQLAWDLHTWFMGQVPTFQRAAILAAQRSALAALPALARVQAQNTPPALASPPPRAAAHFAATLARAA